jgi:hypothetical protein
VNDLVFGTVLDAVSAQCAALATAATRKNLDVVSVRLSFAPRNDIYYMTQVYLDAVTADGRRYYANRPCLVDTPVATRWLQESRK